MNLDALVKDWLSATGRVCDGSADGLAWMERYETDYLRAWQECPRGDWLVLIAAALGADEEKVFGVACEVSRGAVDALPSVVDWPRNAVGRALERRSAPPRVLPDDSSASSAILDAAEEELDLIGRASARLDDALRIELRGVVAECLGPLPLRDLPGGVMRACDAVARAHETRATLVERRERYFLEQRALLLAHATTAAGACLVGASVSTGFVTSPRARGAPYVPHAKSSSSRFRRDTLLVEAHRAVLQSSCALARVSVASAAAWDEGTFAYASGLVASLLIARDRGLDDVDETATREREVALARAFMCAFADAQRGVAGRLRAAIPFVSFAESSRASWPRKRLAARSMLGHALDQLRGSATAAIETLQSVRESLDTPCPPSSRTLLPILATLREQLTSGDDALVRAIDRNATLHAERIVARSERRERGERGDERSTN